MIRLIMDRSACWRALPRARAPEQAADALRDKYELGVHIVNRGSNRRSTRASMVASPLLIVQVRSKKSVSSSEL